MNTLTLYRFFDDADQLLYVGLTINPGRRMEKHSSTKPWWATVARIEMEQHPTLEALKAAERAAIQTEKPLHNIRMNGDAKPLAAAMPDAKLDGLAGRWFHSWRPARDTDTEYATRRGDLVLEWQGQVLERVDDGLYLVQTYSWMDGTPYTQELATTTQMSSWTFYSTHIEMIAAFGCRESFHGVDCGSPAEYLSENRGLGVTAVCEHCAGYYGQVRPIIWKDGVATLGAPTRRPHPLAEVTG